MKKRLAAAFLFLCLFVCSVQVFASAEALEQDLYEDWIWEPVVEKDDSLSTGQAALWACITFGSYPQTEIVPAAFTAVDEVTLFITHLQPVTQLIGRDRHNIALPDAAGDDQVQLPAGNLFVQQQHIHQFIR